MKTSLVDTSDNQNTKKPLTAEDIDDGLKKMDKTYGTSFYNWLQDPSHIDSIAVHTKRVIQNRSPEEIALGLNWLTKNWSTPLLAELLIKTFYHLGIGSEVFAQTVYHLSKKLTVPRDKYDLILILLIGEDYSTVASFLVNYASKLSTKDTMELVISICVEMKWDVNYLKQFIVDFIRKMYSDYDPDTGIKMISRIESVSMLLNSTLKTANTDPELVSIRNALKKEGPMSTYIALLDMIVEDFKCTFNVKDTETETTELKFSRLNIKV